MSGLLNGQEIKDGNFIVDPTDKGFRSASYDIRIGKVIGPDGLLLDSYNLPPQGIVEVVSLERIRLPLEISGYALVKTGLCNEGLLALNIGIIDPGYDGLLSSALVNFSKKDRLLIAGETFLRLTFHRVAASEGAKLPVPMAVEDYVSDKRRKVVENFSKHFLNVPDLVRESTDESVKKLRNTFFWGVPLMAFGLAVLTFMMNYGVIWAVQRTFNPTNSVEAAQSQVEMESQNELLRTTLRNSEAQNATLKARLDTLETQIKALSAAPATTKPKAP
jgi:hypothetical protein